MPLPEGLPSQLDDECAWQAYARAMGASTSISIIQEAMLRQQSLPADHLDGYMNRFWLHEPGAHLYPCRVHNILRRDDDRHPHDHPWSFRSIVLLGSYVEELLLPDGSLKRQRVSAGETYCRVAGQYHRIAEISSEPLWTICFLGEKHPTGWGFLVDGQHIDRRQYLNA